MKISSKKVIKHILVKFKKNLPEMTKNYTVLIRIENI